MPVAAIYTCDAIRYAYVELAKHTTHGKLVLDLSGNVSTPLGPAI